jgi:hypothetical protein
VQRVRPLRLEVLPIRPRLGRNPSAGDPVRGQKMVVVEKSSSRSREEGES